MQQGLGVDIVHIPRIANHERDDRFLGRVFTDGERRDAGEGPARSARLAARFAAKEAAAKALGCGIGEELAFRDVEVVKDPSGRPELLLSPEAAARHGHPVTLLSLSHDGDYAIAVVWIIARENA